MFDFEDHIVDAHQHFQDIECYSYPWLRPDQPPKLEGDLSPIRRNYLPADYRRSVQGFPVTKTVHVQNGWDPSDPVGETRWLASLAVATGWPTAIVAHADLSTAGIGSILDEHCACSAVRGIRQILNWHDNPSLRVASAIDLMQSDAWRRGFAELAARGLSFDLQIYWKQMRMARELAEDFGGTSLVLNHFGMPIDRSGEGVAGWRAALRDLARAENVSVKLSGFGLGHPAWTSKDTVPLLQEVIDLFGPERTMFGSNLPVDLLFSRAEKLFETLELCLARYLPADRAMVLHGSAERVYRL